MSFDEREAISRLDAYLDAVATDRPLPGDVDPELAAVDRAMRALDRAPEPSPEFAAHLLERITRGELLIGHTSAPRTLGQLFTANGRVRLDSPPFALPGSSERRQRWAVAHLATAALLVITLVAGLLAAGHLRPPRGGEHSVILPAVSTPEPTVPVEFLWETYGGPNLPLEDPFRLAIDPQGNLWVADGKNSRFQIFAQDGTFLEAWGTPGDGEGEFDFSDPGLFGGYGAGAVAFDREGNIYVADIGNRRIQKFAPDRTFLTAWGSFGFEPGDFYAISDLVVDGQGRVYVADYMQSTIQVFDSDGKFLASWSRLQGAPPLNPEGLAIDPDGHIWVAEYAQNRVRKLAPDGTRLIDWGEFGFDSGQLGSPYDVALDDRGRVFVAEDTNDRVQVFDGQGNLLGGWGEYGDAAGQFNGPVSLVLDGHGNIYVTDSLNHRVQKFRLLPPLGGIL